MVFCGVAGDGFEEVYNKGVDAVYPILPNLVSLENALRNGKNNLYQKVFKVAKTLFINCG
jgi:glycerate kinase